MGFELLNCDYIRSLITPTRTPSQTMSSDGSEACRQKGSHITCCSICVPLVHVHTKAYLKVSGLASWSENCKWYSSLLLSAVVSLFCESV